ncbi:hypothetical protein EV359DRAFT_87559 [Lentinula novae-zelandiae]|nr:hypothetical protein EV359DRAFT_87559 [Lentinula novae-zelandiae]
MTTSRTTTTTVPPPASTSSRPADPPSPGASLDDDEDLIMREALARVERVKARKAEEAARKKAEEEAAKKAAEEAATARSRWGSSPEETSGSPRRPVVEIRRIRSKGKEKAQEEAAGGDPDNSRDENDDDEDDRTPCERCRAKKISCQMQAGKRSSIICKPCHDAKVKCSYSGRPSIVKKEVSAHPTGERLAVLESQVAQLLADNRQLRRRSPPELPEAGPSGLSKKRRRVVDSDEEEEMGMEKEQEEVEVEVEVEEEGGEERDEPAPKKARSEKGKEREE